MDAQKKPLIMILVKRMAIFMLVICAVSIFYWVVGSVGSFLDDTQAMLLGLTRLSSLGIVASACIGILLAAGFAAARRYRLKALGLAAYFLAASFGFAALYLAQSVLILSHGLH
jgi:hypothetical protein